jgi:cellulose synthase/poly-beta-1,6-N-acetylglucosamine synthase-like glycosyltransferase
MESFFGILYLTALLGFVVFGLHRFVMLVRFFHHRRRVRPNPRIDFGPDAPRVCVQCPIFNEPLVVEELLEAVTAIEWPAGRLEVQILDDSTDGTPEIAERWLQQNPARAAICRHIRRSNRSGYKAGALAEGLKQSKAEFFAILDADFRPESDFLLRLMPLFTGPRVAAVQARWEFINREHNLLTRVQAVFLDAHFLVEQFTRHAAGLFFNFNGTAGIWRRAAIDDAGGWSADSVTEDLDLCYRVQMRGWRMVYENDYTVASELPESISAFKAQQRRWTKGGVQVFRKLIGRILTSPLPLRVKTEACFHLGIGFVHFFLIAFIVSLVPTLVFVGSVPSGPTMILNPILVVVGTGATLAFYLSGQYFRKGRLGHGLMMAVAAPAVMAFGLAMSVTCFFALLEGLVTHGGEFVRTPKGGLQVRGRSELRRSLARASQSLVTGVELLIAVVLAGSALHFLDIGKEGVAFTLALKSVGFGVLGLSSLRDMGWRALLPGGMSDSPPAGAVR